MATSGSVTTSSYNGRYGVLSWSSTSSGNKSTISWSMDLRGGANSWYITSQCYFTVSCSKGSSNVSTVTVLSYDTSREGYVGNIGSGSFTITHDSNAQASFSISLSLATYSWAVNCTGSGSWSLPTLYTSCSAPTSVSASSYVAPSGSFNVSWSGAGGGTNNSISSYQIYWRVTPNGAAPTTSTYTGTKNVVSTSSSGSTTITLSSATRGYKVVCGVVTQGSAGSSYYSGIKTGGSVTVNHVPNAPTASADTTRVPSTGATVKFTVTAGSDSDVQSRTLYYSTSSSGTKTKFTSPLSKAISSASTYYFYTYDGIEYSSATNISISLNTKPSISSVTSSSLSSYNAWGGTGASGYQYGYAYAVTPKISVNKTGTLMVTAELEYWNNTSSQFTKDYDYSFPNYSMTSTSNVVLNNYDLHTAAVAKVAESTRQSYDVRWRLKFVLSDGLEQSNAVYWPASGYYYTIAKSPTLTNSYNQFADSNITGTNTGQVWRRVRMKFYNDTSVTTISVAATVGGIAVSPTSTTSVNGNYRYVDVTLPDNIAGSSAIAITASLTNTSASITKKVTCNVTESPAPTMGSITHGASTIYPFTETGTYQVSTVWPFGSYSSVDSTTLRAYNCSTTVSNVIKFVHASNTSGANQVVKTLTWAKSGDNFATTMDRATAYGWNHELGYTTYVGSKTYYCQLQITNLFGKTFTSGWLSRTFNFNELAQTPTISTVQWAQTNTASTSWTTFQTGASGDAIQESLYLRFGLNFELFTEDKITVNLRLTNDADTNTVLTQEFQASELLRATGRTAASNTVELVYGPVSNISTSNNRKWTFQVTTTRGTATSAEITMRAQRQTAPTTNFLECSTTQDYDLTYEFTQTDTGGGNLQNCLYIVGEDYEVWQEASGAPLDSNKLYYEKNINNEFVLTNDTVKVSGKTYYIYIGETDILSSTDSSIATRITGWDVKSICIKSVSTVTGLITRTVDYYSNYIIVYQLSPTVAYRKNQLGVNTNLPAPGAAVDIHQSTGANSILFQGRDANNNTLKFDININGTITFYVNDEVTHTLDMVNGTLT